LLRTDPGIGARVARALEETGFPPRALELEITENLLMQPTQEILLVLDRFNELGIRLTIDDFGIGYSSLSYLQRFPIKALKIDRTFVHRIGQALHDDTIVSAIIALAHSLHLRVLAEGVETAAQLEFLQTRGCRAAQGSNWRLIASPSPAPPSRRRASATCSKGWNTRANSLSLMPMPLSSTSKRRCTSFSPAAAAEGAATHMTRKVTSPESVNLTALESRFSSTCRNLFSSTQTVSGRSDAASNTKRRPLSSALCWIVSHTICRNTAR
jgi:hypothetical protein